MIKKVKFLRHYRPQYPFNHWTNMSWQEFKDFSEGRANPGISQEGLVDTIKQELKDFYFDVVLAGSKKRQVETAESIVKIKKPRTAIIQLGIFNEIPSKVKDELTEKEWAKMKEKGKVQIKKERILSCEETLKRIREIEFYLNSIKETNVLVISSSYLIGQCRYWFEIINRREDLFNSEDAQKHEIGGWLKGFECIVE